MSHVLKTNAQKSQISQCHGRKKWSALIVPPPNFFRAGTIK